MDNFDPEGVQPSGGVAFLSYGHYGSRTFDPMDGSFIELVICDSCILKLKERGLITSGTPAQKSRSKRKIWL